MQDDGEDEMRTKDDDEDDEKETMIQITTKMRNSNNQ